MAEDIDPYEKMIYDHNWEDIMTGVIQGINKSIADLLDEGHTPTVLLISASSIQQLVEFCGVSEQINWSNPEGVVLDFGEVSLRIYRTTDLGKGKIRVV